MAAAARGCGPAIILGMKVLDLGCALDHRFEGWFDSDEDCARQLGDGSLQCPLCGDAGIRRLPSAARLNVATSRGEGQDQAVARQQQWLQAMRRMLASVDDVGERFSEEARRIHYGEADERAIRGRATADEAEALRDEGIEVHALLLPEVLKDPVQ